MRAQAPVSSTDPSSQPGTSDPAALLDEGRTIADIIPGLAGISVGRLDGDVVATWAATDRIASVLDASQYLAGGPCVAAVCDGRVVETRPAASPATAWPLFARAATAAGVRATLSLPVQAADGRGPVGSVNLYATSEDAFEGRHDELVAWCARWAPAAAVARGGQSFSVRHQQAAGPERHRDQNAVDWFVATLATELGTDVAVAAERLRSAAVRAGLGESEVAQSLDRLLAG
jgi:hypothetical protein